ncbi:MAG TPA: HD domain-containing protein [candidate division Zixibacteria bacterium]|nr:HD domain-containing protein [candidate division Zixibacteria bacterium]
MAPKDLEQQLAFIIEIDKLKNVVRQTLLTDQSRRENSAEHSWHLAIMAELLRNYAATQVDVLRVMKMVLVHDIVEIDAGDAFAYDPAANLGKSDREHQAANRIFGLLPEEQANELRALWREFEANATDDARYANALDRLHPLLHNWHTEGGTWRIHKVRRDQVYRRMDPLRTATPELWPTVVDMIEQSCAKGWIATE